MKKIIPLIAALFVFTTSVYANASEKWKIEFPWAVSGVEYCVKYGIMTGEDGDLMLDRKITRSQTAKMVTEAFGLKDTGYNSFIDSNSSSWDYTYINAIEPYMINKENNFNGTAYVTREEFTALIASVMGYSSEYDNTLHSVFSDASKINYDYRGYILNAVNAGIITGSNGNFRPKSNLTRAEACTIIYRAAEIYKSTSQPLPEQSEESSENENTQQFTGTTNILGEPQITCEQAQKWAKAMGATQKFIDIAPTYWYYGELMGIRPEVLYAQAALETGYGQYTGVVSEDMNNWAGIKVKGRNDDAKDAHESFATPEEGARAHFNHMAAYVGVEPVGTPHDRYYSVKSMSWAGTVRTLEELSGKWCPDTEYASKILNGCLEPMSKF